MKETFEFKQIGKLAPSKDFKEQAKMRLMQRIRRTESSWLESVLYDFQKIKAPQNFKLLSKERVFHKISNPTFLPIWLKKLFLSKKFISLATTISVLFVSIFSFAIYTPQTVEASNSVYLVITEGNPIIKQLGSTWEMAVQLQELKIGDTIKTDHDDIVEVHFFDNSVTRLANNTELTITTFFKEYQKEKVELKLNEGRAWNKVIQAGSNVSNFTVNTHNSSISTKNATFDIVAGENKPTSINVVDHLIDVKILQNNAANVVAKTKVAEGYNVEVQVSNKKTIAQTAQITPLDEEKHDIWYTDNLAKDKVHLENLEKKREEKIIAAAGILPNSPFYGVKKGFNAITRSDNPATEIKNIKQKFQEAAALNSRNELEESKLALNEFTKLFSQATTKGTLNSQLEELLAEIQTDYVTALPGDKSYNIKEVLRALELQVAQNPKSILLKRTTEKLFEAQDLVENGSSELAASLLASINNDYQNKSTTGSTLEENKKDIILQKTEELQILQALKENIKDAEADDLIAIVDSIHKNTVLEINKLAPQPPRAIKTEIIAIKKVDPKVRAQEFIEKINIYKTQRGQDNQILSLLNKIPNNKKQIATLTEIKKLLPENKQYLITQKILEIANK